MFVARGTRPVGPTTRVLLCATLRGIREERGLTGFDVAHRLHWSTSKVSRFENGTTALPPREVTELLDLYGIGGEDRAALLALAEGTTRRNWWDTYPVEDLPTDAVAAIRAENEATGILTLGTTTIPALLRTDAYDEALAASWANIHRCSPAQRRRRLDAEQIRRTVLIRERVTVHAVITDTATTCPAGVPRVLQAQHDHLDALAARPNVTITVVPSTTPLLAHASTLTVYSYPPPVPDLAVAEHLNTPQIIEDEQRVWWARCLITDLAHAGHPWPGPGLILDRGSAEIAAVLGADQWHTGRNTPEVPYQEVPYA